MTAPCRSRNRARWHAARRRNATNRSAPRGSVPKSSPRGQRRRRPVCTAARLPTASCRRMTVTFARQLTRESRATPTACRSGPTIATPATGKAGARGFRRGNHSALDYRTPKAFSTERQRRPRLRREAARCRAMSMRSSRLTLEGGTTRSGGTKRSSRPLETSCLRCSAASRAHSRAHAHDIASVEGVVAGVKLARSWGASAFQLAVADLGAGRPHYSGPTRGSPQYSRTT